MRRHLPRFAALTVLGALAVAILPSNAADPEGDHKDILVTIVYPIHDLPVFKLNDNGLEFDPSILIAHIKSDVDENSWNKDRGSIVPHEKMISLVIRQTQANHKRIADVLAKLRGEEIEELFQKVSKVQAAKPQATNVGH